jgi:hypothetical protein
MQHHIKYGLITAAILIISIILVYGLKIDLNSNLQMGFAMGLIAIGVIQSCIQFKKNNTAASSNEIFFNGFRTTAIIALLVLAFGFIIITLIPSIKNDMADKFRADLLKTTKELTNNTIEAQVADYKSKFTTMFIGINMMIIVISGLISSFIGLVITKNK